MPPRRDPARFVPLILAAGASSRMGRPKAALAFGETTALGTILSTCRAAGLAPAVVVSGAHPAAVAEAAAGHEPAPRLVEHPGWAAGRATSIQAGLAALDLGAIDGVLLWPVDVCLPGLPVVRSLLTDAAVHPEPETLAWVPSLEGRRGHPILLSSEAARRLRALGPDDSARSVVHALHAEGKLRHLIVADRTVRMEMNTPEEYARWSSV